VSALQHKKPKLAILALFVLKIVFVVQLVDAYVIAVRQR
jgi:hypothetical protein